MDKPHATKRRSRVFRTNYLIYPGPQLTIVGFLIMIFWMMMAILYVGLTRMITSIDLEGIHASATQADLLMQLHESRLALLSEFFIIFVLIATFIMAAGGVFLSHRIVGPIYRIRMILEQWCRGQKPFPIKCRDEDFFQELFPLIEKLVLKSFADQVEPAKKTTVE